MTWNSCPRHDVVLAELLKWDEAAVCSLESVTDRPPRATSPAVRTGEEAVMRSRLGSPVGRRGHPGRGGTCPPPAACGGVSVLPASPLAESLGAVATRADRGRPSYCFAAADPCGGSQR